MTRGGGGCFGGKQIRWFTHCRWRTFLADARENYFWRLSAIGRSSWDIYLIYFYAARSARSFSKDASNEFDCVRSKKNFTPWSYEGLPPLRDQSRRSADYIFGKWHVRGWKERSRSVRQRGRIGSTVLVKAIYRPFLFLCLTYAYRCASSATARRGARKCERKSVYARYADRSRVYRPHYACIGTYTATLRPETRFARLIKQVIIVSAHPIFVRPCGRA